MGKHRLTIDMTYKDMVMAMCDGNPGCINVLMALATETPEVDKASALGAFGPITMMDEWGIYGSKVWVFFKDLCGQELWKVIGLTRAAQCGFTSREKLILAINYADSHRCAPPDFDIPALLAQVKEYLGDGFVIPDAKARI